MELSKFMALGAVPIFYTVAGNKTDDNVLKAPKYQDQGAAASPAIDSESEFIIVGWQATMDTAGKFALENATGGDGTGSNVKTVLPTQYLSTNTPPALVDCFLPVGKGNPILITTTNPGNLTLILYVIDKNYKNRNRVPLNT